VDNGGANQTVWVSENSYSHVLWFCATVVNSGIWRIPTWLFLQCIFDTVKSRRGGIFDAIESKPCGVVETAKSKFGIAVDTAKSNSAMFLTVLGQVGGVVDSAGPNNNNLN
jgi:hypothetical protein